MDMPQPDKDGIVIIDGRRMRIEQDGSITALDGNDVARPATAAEKEQTNLDYLIDNHPDRLSDVDAARARRDALRQENGDDSDGTAATKKKAELRAAISKIKLQAGITAMAQQKQND